jgi:hypothetical protein
MMMQFPFLFPCPDAGFIPCPKKELLASLQNKWKAERKAEQPKNVRDMKSGFSVTEGEKE